MMLTVMMMIVGWHSDQYDGDRICWWDNANDSDDLAAGMIFSDDGDRLDVGVMLITITMTLLVG